MKVKGIPICVILLLYVFQYYLSTIIPLFGYTDELLTIAAFIYIALHGRGLTKFTVKTRRLCIALEYLGIMLLAIIANVVYEYQSFFYITIDIFAYIKFPICLWAGILFAKKGIYDGNKVVQIIRIIAIIHVMLMLHEQFMSPWFGAGRVGLMHVQRLFYTNSTYMAAISVFLYCTYIYSKGSDGNHAIYEAALLLSVILTIRAKAMGFAAFAIALRLATKITRIKKPYLLLILCLPIVLAIAWDKIDYYFIQQTGYKPRAHSIQDGFLLAKMHFPFGTGFGTFCSTGAGIGGSAVYSLLSHDYTSDYAKRFVNDMYWGYAIGQYGYIGLALLVSAFIGVFSESWKLQYSSRNCFLAAVSAMTYMLIASTGESSFYSSYCVGFAFLIGMCWSSASRAGYENETQRLL